jgi:hypothetical protein
MDGERGGCKTGEKDRYHMTNTTMELRCPPFRQSIVFYSNFFFCPTQFVESDNFYFFDD